jgi:hypothetical protein
MGVQLGLSLSIRITDSGRLRMEYKECLGLRNLQKCEYSENCMCLNKIALKMCH